MSEVREERPGAGGGKRKAVWAGLGLIAILAVLYGAWALVFKSPEPQDLKSLARGTMAKLEVAQAAAPETRIKAVDAAGKPVSLADFKGEVVVLNLWATWCAPCVKEMPELAALQAAYKGKPVKVIPISLDKGDPAIAKAKSFIADKQPLEFYHGEMALAFDLSTGSPGLPVTILYDRAGREQARLAGGADWNTPDAKAVIDRILAAQG